MSLDEDAALEHYGVKGMKWGVRREAKRDANKFATEYNVMKIKQQFKNFV